MKHVLLAIAAIAVLATATLALAREPVVGEALIGAALWMRDAGALGLAIFALAYVVATIALAPAVALNVPTGVAFGFLWGGLLSIPVSIAAATLAFLLGRSILRKPLERRFRGDRRLAAIDRAVHTRGFMVVLLLRLTPAVPFAPANYLLALTRVRTRDFVLGTTLGMLPFTALFVYLGSASSDAASLLRGEGAQPWHIALLALSAASALLLTVATARLARRQLAALA